VLKSFGCFDQVLAKSITNGIDFLILRRLVNGNMNGHCFGVLDKLASLGLPNRDFGSILDFEFPQHKGDAVKQRGFGSCGQGKPNKPHVFPGKFARPLEERRAFGFVLKEIDWNFTNPFECSVDKSSGSKKRLVGIFPNTEEIWARNGSEPDQVKTVEDMVIHLQLSSVLWRRIVGQIMEHFHGPPINKGVALSQKDFFRNVMALNPFRERTYQCVQSTICPRIVIRPFRVFNFARLFHERVFAEDNHSKTRAVSRAKFPALNLSD